MSVSLMSFGERDTIPCASVGHTVQTYCLQHWTVLKIEADLALLGRSAMYYKVTKEDGTSPTLMQDSEKAQFPSARTKRLHKFQQLELIGFSCLLISRTTENISHLNQSEEDFP